MEQTGLDPVVYARAIVLTRMAIECCQSGSMNAAQQQRRLFEHELVGVSKRCLAANLIVILAFGLVALAYLYWHVFAR